MTRQRVPRRRRPSKVWRRRMRSVPCRIWCIAISTSCWILWTTVTWLDWMPILNTTAMWWTTISWTAPCWRTTAACWLWPSSAAAASSWPIQRSRLHWEFHPQRRRCISCWRSSTDWLKARLIRLRRSSPSRRDWGVEWGVDAHSALAWMMSGRTCWRRSRSGRRMCNLWLIVVINTWSRGLFLFRVFEKTKEFLWVWAISIISINCMPLAPANYRLVLTWETYFEQQLILLEQLVGGNCLLRNHETRLQSHLRPQQSWDYREYPHLWSLPQEPSYCSVTELKRKVPEEIKQGSNHLAVVWLFGTKAYNGRLILLYTHLKDIHVRSCIYCRCPYL